MEEVGHLASVAINQDDTFVPCSHHQSYPMCQGLEYPGKTRSMSWLLMSWPLMSQSLGLSETSYWLCNKWQLLSSMKKDFILVWRNGINSLRPSDAYICVSELTIIGSDNGLSPGRCQAIIWNNAGLLLIEPLETNFSEISIRIQTFSFKKMYLNTSSAKWHPFCLSLNVLNVNTY